MGEKEALLTIEWNCATLAQRVFVQAVVVPELEAVLRRYASAIIELAEEREEK